MQTKAKKQAQRKAATAVAKLMYASLQKFPEMEQEERLNTIRRIALKIFPNRIGLWKPKQ
jgi:hypothetical protein